MQSHASRHVVSEFLKDLHPDLSPPFPTEIIKDEIAEAYGRRGVKKLIDVLALPADALSHEDRAHALRVFKGLLSTQEHKTEAINEGAAVPLCHLVGTSPDDEVRKLSCDCLASMAQILPGRNAIVAANGFEDLTKALKLSPEAAAGALREFSKSNDGVALLNTVLDTVVPALVELIIDNLDKRITMKACENAAATLGGIATTDAGICSGLTHKVPACMVVLIDRSKDKYKWEKELMVCMAEAASCMEQICHHPYGKTAARESDAIRAIAELMRLGLYHPLTVRKCSSALMGVSIEKESKVPVMEYAGETLVKLLKGDNEELLGNARSALQNSCEHLQARKMMEGLLNDEEMKTILYQKKPLPPTPPDFRYQVILPLAKKPPSLAPQQSLFND